jgi:nucleotide-binding universal stress UspA family protein
MKTILVPIDFSASTPAVVKAAEDFGRGPQTRIVLITATRPPVVLNENAPDIEDFIRRDRDNAGRKMAACGAKLAADGFDVEPVVRFGPPVECILEEARRIHADYIVMGSHGHTAIYELFVGGTTAGVLKVAPCPVLVVPTKRI